MRINIKPLSVNQCWQGHRYKTPKYNAYEKEFLLKLPMVKIPNPPFILKVIYGFSNSMSDIDNCQKPLQDILQKKYNINDRDIYRLEIDKEIVKKGNEFIDIKLEHYGRNQI